MIIFFSGQILLLGNDTLKQIIDWRFDSDLRYFTEKVECVAVGEICATTNEINFSEKEADRVKVIPFRNLSVEYSKKLNNEEFYDLTVSNVKPTEFTIGTAGHYYRLFLSFQN